MKDMVWMIALSGAGTFLLRWLPLWRARNRRTAQAGAEGVQRWLAGVGPGAIAALLIVAIVGVLEVDARVGKVSCAAGALACVWGVRWLRGGGVAVPTLSGAVVFGLLSWWLG